MNSTARSIPPALIEYFVFLVIVVCVLVGIAVVWSRLGRTGIRKQNHENRPKHRKRKKQR